MMIMSNHFSDREVAMIEDFRQLPQEVRNSIEQTIRLQAQRYAPVRAPKKDMPRLSLVGASSRR